MSRSTIYDVAVIGAGIVGCAVARELSRYKLSAVVLEKYAEISTGSSEANSGIVHAGYDPEPGTLKARFNVEGARMYPELCRELHVPYEQTGALVVAYSDDEVATLRKLLERGIQNGVEKLRIVSQPELSQLEPELSGNAIAALFAETSGIVCPYGITFALADDAAANGVEFLREHGVESIRRLDGCYELTTAQGVINAKTVVNAAGLYSDVINNMVSTDKLTIKPSRGQYWLIDRSLEGAIKHTLFRTPTALGKGILVTPTVDGTLLIGPNAEAINNKSDVGTTSDGLDKVFREAQITWPTVNKKSFIASFAGNRAKGDRGDFVIGEAPDAEGFYNAAAIESPGLTSAPAIGKYLAELISEKLGAARKPADDIVPFSPPAKPFSRMTNKERHEAIRRDPDYGSMICRCENITEAEIRDSIRRPVGAVTIDGIKHRTRTGMGRCQGGFCTPRVVDILCEELGIKPEEVTRDGKGSELLCCDIWSVDSFGEDGERR